MRKNGETVVLKEPEDGKIALMHGVVTDAVSGRPLEGASVDIWQASTNGE